MRVIREYALLRLFHLGNFEYYFAEIAPFLLPGKPPQIDKLWETATKYGLIVDVSAAEEIIKKYGLKPLA